METSEPILRFSSQVEFTANWINESRWYCTNTCFSLSHSAHAKRLTLNFAHTRMIHRRVPRTHSGYVRGSFILFACHRGRPSKTTILSLFVLKTCACGENKCTFMYTYKCRYIVCPFATKVIICTYIRFFFIILCINKKILNLKYVHISKNHCIMEWILHCALCVVLWYWHYTRYSYYVFLVNALQKKSRTPQNGATL